MAKVKIPISMDRASFTGDDVQEARADGTRATQLELKTSSFSATAHYLMNDNAATTTVEDETGSHDGVCTSNTSTISVTGKINNALEFGGSDKVTVSHSTDFCMHDGDGDLPFSLSLWIKMDSGWSGLSGEQFIFCKQQAIGGEWLLMIEDTGMRLVLMDSTEGGMIAASYDMSSVGSGWCHLVWTYDGSGSNTGISLYVNDSGVSVSPGSDGTYVQMRTLTGADVYIGGGYGGYFTCDGIDDVRIYKDTELSSDQVSDIYNSGDGTEDDIGGGYPTSTEITLADLDAQSTLATWDMSTIEIFENPDSEAGTIKYKYAYGDSVNPTNWNGSWLSKAELQAESDVQGRYFALKIQITGDGTQEGAVSDGYLDCTIPTEFSSGGCS